MKYDLCFLAICICICKIFSCFYFPCDGKRRIKFFFLKTLFFIIFNCNYYLFFLKGLNNGLHIFRTICTLFHKVSVRSNSTFYDLGSFNKLELIILSLAILSADAEGSSYCHRWNIYVLKSLMISLTLKKKPLKILIMDNDSGESLIK